MLDVRLYSDASFRVKPIVGMKRTRESSVDVSARLDEVSSRCLNFHFSCLILCYLIESYSVSE